MINYLASIKDDCENDSAVFDYFHTLSAKIVQLPRAWWKIDTSNNIQMEGFKGLTMVDLTVPEIKSDNEVTIFSRIDELGFVIHMLKEKNLRVFGK
jgi:hypothetical protein